MNNNFKYWQVQSDKLLFPDIAWNKPEQKAMAGKLLIVGGNKSSFLSLATTYNIALKTGIGEVKVLIPDTLKKIIKIDNNDVIYTLSNPSGGFASSSLDDIKAGEKWADALLFIGDINKDSETAVVFEKFLLESNKPVLIARDSVDILINSFTELLEKPNITIFASFNQLQKIFKNTFFPKALTFSMQFNNLVDTLHKFTLSYPCQVITLHQDNVAVSLDGEVYSMPISSKINNGKVTPLRIWTGEIPAKVISYQIWNKDKAKASITSLVD